MGLKMQRQEGVQWRLIIKTDRTGRNKDGSTIYIIYIVLKLLAYYIIDRHKKAIICTNCAGQSFWLLAMFLLVGTRILLIPHLAPEQSHTRGPIVVIPLGLGVIQGAVVEYGEGSRKKGNMERQSW